MVYGYYKAVTTAVTGTARGLRGSCNSAIASAAGTFEGVYGRACNGTTTVADDGLNLATARGGSFLVALAGKTGAVPTVASAEGIYVQADLDAAQATVTAAHGARINLQTGSATNNTVSALWGLTVEHESVAGTAKTLNAFIQLKAVSGNEPVTCLIDASTVGGMTVTGGDQVTLLKFKDSAGAAKSLVYDLSDAAVKVV
jgi:hypothetical protein